MTLALVAPALLPACTQGPAGGSPPGDGVVRSRSGLTAAGPGALGGSPGRASLSATPPPGVAPPAWRPQIGAESVFRLHEQGTARVALGVLAKALARSVEGAEAGAATSTDAVHDQTASYVIDATVHSRVLAADADGWTAAVRLQDVRFQVNGGVDTRTALLQTPFIVRCGPAGQTVATTFPNQYPDTVRRSVLQCPSPRPPFRASRRRRAIFPPRASHARRAAAMTRAEIARRRLRAQGLLPTRCDAPRDAVAAVCALQAQDYLGALWAVGIRLRQATEGGVERALATGTVVRTWPLRGTLHLVAAEDVRWMLALTGPRQIATGARRHRELGLDEATIARSRRIVARALEHGPRTRPDLFGELRAGGVSPAGQRGIHILQRLAHEALLCYGPRADRQATFVLLDRWVPAGSTLPAEEALATLARRYFAGHGPASLADFAWWSGLTTTAAREGLELAKDGLRRDSDDDGVELWSAPAHGGSRPAAEALLLPPFDEVLAGYRDRAALIETSDWPRINEGGGLLKPALLAGGRVVGTWRRTLRRREVSIEVAPFRRLGTGARRGLARACRRYAAFLGLEMEATGL